MKLRLLSNTSVEDVIELKYLLSKFQEEVYGCTTTIDALRFIEGHYAIYFVVNELGFIVGFSSFVYNDYYSLREATIGNDYIFIEKEYRRSKAMHLISIQAGKLCLDTGCPLEHYIVKDSGSEKFVGRLNGKKLYTTYEFDLAEVKRETDRLLTKVKIKEK